MAKLVQDKKSVSEAIDDPYLAAYARYLTALEREKKLAYVAGQSSETRGLEDIVWALVNSREFLFNH